MKCTYQVVQSTYPYISEAPRTYGIAATTTYDGCMVVLESVHDICQDFAAITKLAEVCNQLQLDPIHLQDVVDDYLADQ